MACQYLGSHHRTTSSVVDVPPLLPPLLPDRLTLLHQTSPHSHISLGVPSPRPCQLLLVPLHETRFLPRLPQVLRHGPLCVVGDLVDIIGLPIRRPVASPLGLQL